MHNTATQPAPAILLQGFPSARAAYKAWRQAIGSLRVDHVLRIYEPQDAVLWGTLAQTPLQGHDEIRTYFDDFLNRTYIRVTTRDCRFRGISNDIVIATGSYVFELGQKRNTTAPHGNPTTVPARFTFVFRQQPGSNTWRILEHHSSMFPPGAEPSSLSLS